MERWTMATPLLAEAAGPVAEQVRQSTVMVTVGRGRGRGAGAGVVWRDDGLVVTNAHVAHGDEARVTLCDGRAFEARVVRRDPGRDLAALALPAGGARDLPVAEVGDSDALRPGELVLAVGCPFGVAGAVATGIVHAAGAARGPGGRRWLRADVRLAPGNSGGPLADAYGRVVGINSMIANGLALAVPSRDVTRFVAGNDEAASLGVSVQPVGVRGADGVRLGLLVLAVVPAGAAAAAGLLVGDVILGADGRAFTAPDELRGIVAEAQPAGVVRLELARGGRRTVREVVLGDAAAAAAA